MIGGDSILLIGQIMFPVPMGEQKSTVLLQYFIFSRNGRFQHTEIGALITNMDIVDRLQNGAILCVGPVPKIITV